MKIVFMGTPDFAKESLKALYEADYQIEAVVTNPDRKKGRGMKLIPSPVKEYALNKQIPILQPEKVRGNQEFIEEIKKINPDVICVVAYGKILPKELLEIPRLGAINVHGSLLPKYRGAAPIQWAVLNGEKETGITTMYMDEGMDTGDMILREKITIGENETTGELWDRLAVLGGQLLVETMEQIQDGTVKRQKQPEGATYAPMLDKQMAKIDFLAQTGKQIKNLVRGLNPMMGAYAFLEGKKIKFWKVEVLMKENFMEQFPEFKEYDYRFETIEPGTVLYVEPKKGLYIKAKDSIISVLELQAENSRKMQIEEFLRGNKIEAITVFE